MEFDSSGVPFCEEIFADKFNPCEFLKMATGASAISEFEGVPVQGRQCEAVRQIAGLPLTGMKGFLLISELLQLPIPELRLRVIPGLILGA